MSRKKDKFKLTDFVPATEPGGDKRVIVHINYIDQPIQQQFAFDSKNIKGAIEIAQLYSEAPEVLITQVILDRLIMLAQFAGFYEGRVYDP